MTAVVMTMATAGPGCMHDHAASWWQSDIEQVYPMYVHSYEWQHQKCEKIPAPTAHVLTQGLADDGHSTYVTVRQSQIADCDTAVHMINRQLAYLCVCIMHAHKYPN